MGRDKKGKRKHLVSVRWSFSSQQFWKILRMVKRKHLPGTQVNIEEALGRKMDGLVKSD